MIKGAFHPDPHCEPQARGQLPGTTHGLVTLQFMTALTTTKKTHLANLADVTPLPEVEIRSLPTDDSLFQEYLRLRGVAFGNNLCAEECDFASEHYIAVRAGSIIAGLRVTRACCASLEVEEHLPRPLLKHYRDSMCSAARMFVRDGVPMDCRFLRLHLVAAAWKCQLDLGTRIDVIAASTRAVPMFARMGYLLLSATPFIHRLRSAVCWPMCFPATPNRATPFHRVLSKAAQPVEEEELRRIVPVHDWRITRNFIDSTAPTRFKE